MLLDLSRNHLVTLVHAAEGQMQQIGAAKSAVYCTGTLDSVASLYKVG